jgi:hypothetical protein
MARLAFALAAIVILTLSAGLAPSQPQATPLIRGAVNTAAFHSNTDAFRAEALLMKRAEILPTAPRPPQEEPLAPALLVYLALILIGSVGSVALARRQLHAED